MKILWKQQAFQKFRAYIHGINYEISGFGKIEKRGDDIVILDVRIFPQEVSAAHTEMDAKGLAHFWEELAVANEDLGAWKLWWHSHVNMQAFFSGTDLDTIDEFDTELPTENWMLSIVTNKSGKTLAQIDIFQPIRCTINDVPWDVEQSNENLTEDVSQEIAQKVTILKPNIQTKINFNKTLITPEEVRLMAKLFPKSEMYNQFLLDGEIVS